MTKPTVHTTHYENALILIAEDCKVTEGKIPPIRGDNKTVAALEFELISENPYRYTSDEVKFEVHCARNGIRKNARKKAYEEYFSKGQPCFRASPLTKTYGWGVHFDAEGKMAIYSVGSKPYQKFAKDKNTKKYNAMRSKK